MTVINNLLEWFGQQNKSQTNTVLFQVLFLAPDYDQYTGNSITDQLSNFSDYLNADIDDGKKIGKILFAINAIDFTVADYGNIDKFIDAQLLHQQVIEAGEEEGRNMQISKDLIAKGPQQLKENTEFKNLWISFRDTELNFQKLKGVLKQNFINGK